MISKTLASLFRRETTTGQFIPVVDGIRFIAILSVVGFHLGGELAKKCAVSYAAQAPNDWLYRLTSYGDHGVKLFFVLSGFILALPFAGHRLGDAKPVDLKQFYLRRVTRLEPPYIISMILLFAALVLMDRHHLVYYIKHLLVSLVYMHNMTYGSMSAINFVAWSLEVEVQFYVLTPLLTMVFLVPGTMFRRSLIAAVALIAVGAQIFFIPGHHRLEMSLLNFLQYFLTGIFLADIYIVDWNKAPKKTLAWDFATIAAACISIPIWRSHLISPLVSPILMLLFLVAAFRGIATNRILSNTVLTSIGGMCYSIYLLHAAVISAVCKHMQHFVVSDRFWVNFVVQFCLLAPILLLVTGGFYLLVEKPCMRKDWPHQLKLKTDRFFAARRASSERGMSGERAMEESRVVF